MNNELKKIIDSLITEIGDKNTENRLKVDFINNFYFENITDSQFFDVNGLKDSFVDFYSNIAKNGVKTIIFGGFYICLKNENKQDIPHIKDNIKNLEVLKKTIKNIHRFGSKTIIKFVPAYGREISFNKTLKIFKRTASFGYDIDDSRLYTLPISDSLITSIKEELISQSIMAEKVNTDGIMIDATLSNILGELISLEFNKRRFGYYPKGSNILFEIIQQIKKKCKLIKIYVKISVFSLIYHTFYNKNKIRTLKNINKIDDVNFIYKTIDKLIESGVSGLELEFGVYENEFLREQNSLASPNIFDDIYEKINTYINEKYREKAIEFFYNNSNISTIIKNDKHCYFNITKQYYSDTHFIKNIKDNLPYKKCINCSYCYESAKTTGRVKCLINPELFYDKLTISDKKNVAIIGGGTSGLVCAMTLAQRGFIVDLYEINNILNKTGQICDIFNMDKYLKDYNDYLLNQINFFSNSSRINLILNKKISCESINKNKYYAIVVATGFKQQILRANGAIQNHVKSLYDILENKDLIKKKKHIVIFAKTELSFKFALYLLKNKYSVSIIISSNHIQNNFIHSNLTYYLFVFNKLNIELYLDAKIKIINEDNAQIVVNKNYSHDYVSTIYNILSKENYKYTPQLKTIDCDLFIYEPETTPNNKLYYDLVKSGYKGELYLIGQALEQGDMANDIESGYFVGKNL